MNNSPLLNRSTELVPIILEICSIAKKREETMADIVKQKGLLEFEPVRVGATISGIDYSEFFIFEEKLKKYLEKLTVDDLRIILSIMYIGRDEQTLEEFVERQKELYREYGGSVDENDCVFDSPQKKIFDYITFLKKGLKFHKKAYINQMIEKKPLNDYLSRGLRILEL